MAKPGRVLSKAELDSYDVIDRSLAETVRVFDVPLVPGGYAGITVGRFIFLAKAVPADGASTLMAHELVHVGQYAKIGVPRYISAYLKSFFPGLFRLRNWNEAYRAIPTEVEARNVSGDWHRRRVGR